MMEAVSAVSAGGQHLSVAAARAARHELRCAAEAKGREARTLLSERYNELLE